MPTSDEIADVYEHATSPGRQLGHTLRNPTFASVAPEVNAHGGVDNWCVAQAQREGKTLLAAHTVARVAEDNSLIDAVIFPNEFSYGLPIILRDIFSSTASRMRDMPDASDEQDAIKEVIRSVMQNDPKGQVIGSSAAVNFLPEADRFRQIIKTVM